MKKILLISVLTLFIISCESKVNNVEVINMVDTQYLNFQQVDSAPNLIKDKEYNDIFKQIDIKINEMGLSISQRDEYQFIFYLNEKGKLEKALVIDGPNEEIVKIIIDQMSKGTYKPALKDGAPVKYKYRYYFESGMRDFTVLDSIPQPIGGLQAIQKHVLYPEIAKRDGIQGMVLVLVDIDKKGNVVNTKVLKGIGAGCDEAAVDAIKKVKFTPAIKDSVPVEFEITIPISFKLK